MSCTLTAAVGAMVLAAKVEHSARRSRATGEAPFARRSLSWLAGPLRSVIGLVTSIVGPSTSIVGPSTSIVGPLTSVVGLATSARRWLGPAVGFATTRAPTAGVQRWVVRYPNADHGGPSLGTDSPKHGSAASNVGSRVTQRWIAAVQR